MDIEINAWDPGFIKPEIMNYEFDVQDRSLRFNQTAYHVKMCSLTFEKPFF